MAACGNQLQKTIKQLKEGTTPDSKTLALTSLRRVHFEDAKVVKMLKDEEFCELCNSVINATITENDKQHIEACRTLDIILPETRHRNFDFFQSILQINRKKRLKILISLSILKDETVAIIASKISILEFLNNCMQSVKAESMTWLLAQNAGNLAELKKMESKTLNETEEFEEKVVENTLKLLGRLCNLSSFGLNVRQFDALLMEKVVTLACMGLKRQRTQALIVLKEAVQNDLGVRIRLMQKEIWDSYKSNLQNVYCKRMTLLVNNNDLDWAIQWETNIALVGTDLHRGSGLVNSLLKVEELAFKSADPNRKQAFISWKVLIDNFALDQRELATNRRIKLLCVPLNAKNSKTELMVLTKLEVWWHLIYKVYPSIGECIDTVLITFLSMCFGPFGDKPLFAQKTDTNVSLGKKFPKTQVFAIYTFMQLIVDKENCAKILSPLVVEDVLPNPVNNSVFESIYKTFIHCFGEILLSLGLLSDTDVTNKTEIYSIMWDSLIQRIEEYDKMKVPMYKEIVNVIVELMKHRFYKIPMIRDFLFNKILKKFDSIANSMSFNETTLMDLTQTFLQVDNFSLFTSDHYQSIETLLQHLIKPNDADVYYPQTMEMMQAILKILDDAKNTKSNMFATCEIWCILARIAKTYIEDSQNINEGTCLQHNFKTIESIISFPFTHIFTDDHDQIKRMSESWIDLYKQFDFQAEFIVTVQGNEILNKTSNILIAALKKEKRCCNLATACISGLLATVNYDHLSTDIEVPAIVQLLNDLTLQCLHIKSFATNNILKALSAFLLRVFTTSVEKTAQYLKIVEPAMKCMLSQTDDNDFELEILNTWSTAVGLFKKLQKFLDHDLLTCYRKTIILAVLHLNKEISSLGLSLLDMKDSVDGKSKKVLEEVIHELEETSLKNNFEIDDVKEKSTKKVRSPHIKPIGSFLNRKGMSPSNSRKDNGKENLEKMKVTIIEPDSQDFVLINTDVQIDVSRLTDHQKEMFKKRRDDIPAMYNDLTVSNSQDTQELQHWFDTKTGKSPTLTVKKGESPSNNNETLKPTSATASHFKNIADVFNIHENVPEKPSMSAKSLSPRAQTRKQQQQATYEDVSAIEDSQQVKINSAPIVVKKLDFESREEFPADSEQQVSPSIIDNIKMRRRTPIEENNGAAVESTVDKNVRTTRRSLQPQQQRVTLRKFNSNEQLNTKRGRKRRNSESNSESALTILHEKRPKRIEIPEELNSSGESSKSNEENKRDIDGKKISKRQLNEMSRLKIDMRFEPLPSRRSAGKLIENVGSNATDKKSISFKDNKSKEEKISASNNKNETNQQGNSTIKRRSMSKITSVTKVESTEKETEKHKRDSGHKKPAAPENLPENNKLITRKSLCDKMELIAPSKKNEIVAETQEETRIEEEPTQMETIDKKSEDIFAKDSESTIDDSESECIKSSQDSDIVESSQEPTNFRPEKMDNCFIKIKKVEDVQLTKAIVEEVQIEKELKELKEPKELKTIKATLIDVEETTSPITLTIIESEKSAPVLQEPKKVETVSAKSTNLVSLMSSPKSTNPRFFRSRAFLQGRAAQMLGLVTKQSLAEKLSSDASKSDVISTDEVTVVPILKRDKVSKENDRVSSPSTGSSCGGSRQEKMFSNMNNMRQEMCLSPSITMFCNLRNDGERISPKLDKHERDSENGIVSIERETQNGSVTSCSDTSPNGKTKKELPLLEWSNANPPSLNASPSASILKRMQEIDVETPSRKKRVSFADPPVSREMGYEIMTESLSPPKLEKLPSGRSPISRKESRKHTKLRPIQMDLSRTEKENDELSNNVETKPTETNVNDETANVTIDAPIISLSPKVMLSTVLSEISVDEARIVEPESQIVVNTQDVDIFSDNNVITASNESLYIAKTSTQNDQSNSCIKLDSINLSNILQKSSDNHITSLEDTVDVENLSSSIEGNSSNLLDKVPRKSCSQQSADPGDTLPVTDSIFSNLPLSQETQNSDAQLIEPETLDSTLPVYPSLVSCEDSVESISADLVDPLFTDNLAKHLSVKSIRSVGDLAQLTERDVNRLPIKSPKLACVKKALSRYESTKKLTRTPEKRSPTPKSSTPLGNKSKDSKTKSESISFDDLMKNSSNNSDLPPINALYDIKRLRKRQSTDSSIQTSPMKKSRKNDEEACTELMDHCDEQILFNAFVKRFTAGKILSAYKEKVSENPEGLQTVLQQLPKIFDSNEDFYDSVLKTYKKELLTVFVNRLSQAKDKSDKEIILNTNDLKIILDNVSPDSIMDQILLRKELTSSEVLLNIALKNSVEKLSESTKQAMFKTLLDKLDVYELADMYNETIKSAVRKGEGK